MWPTPRSRAMSAPPASCCSRACRSAPGSMPPAERKFQLAGRGRVAGQALLRHHAKHRACGNASPRTAPRSCPCAPASPPCRCAPAPAHVVLGVHVGGRAELPGPPRPGRVRHLERAGLVQPRAERIHMGYRDCWLQVPIGGWMSSAPRPRLLSFGHERRPLVRALPAEAARGRGRGPRWGRIAEGHPLRLRARVPGRRARRDRVRRAGPRRLRGRVSGRAPRMTRWPWRGCCASTRRGSRCEDRCWSARPPRATRRACAVVAICPAPEDLLLRLVRAGDPERFRCDVEATTAWLRVGLRLRRRGRARAGHRAAPAPRARRRAGAVHGQRAAPMRRPTTPSGCCCSPGGHHRSIQHDQELQAVSRRFIRDAAGARP